MAGLCGTQAQPVQDGQTRIERVRATGETIPVRARGRVTRVERLRPFRPGVDQVQSSARIHAAGDEPARAGDENQILWLLQAADEVQPIRWSAGGRLGADG